MRHPIIDCKIALIQVATALTCDDLASDYIITVNQLNTWNSWLGSDCDTGLFANLAYYDERAVCIGVNSTAPTKTASAPPANLPTTTKSGTPGPTQTGIVASCTNYYTVQSGDSCAAIEAQFAITFEQFYAWNPAGMRLSIHPFYRVALTFEQWAQTVNLSGSAMYIASQDPSRLHQPQPALPLRRRAT